MPLAVKLHAYCPMTNHIHLLMTPEDASAISHVMQRRPVSIMKSV
jgi:REP element-mobilizing transposase RayT